MGTRTRYFTSALGTRELVGIRSDDTAFGTGATLTAAMTAADVEAFNRVNLLIVYLAGPDAGGTILTEFFNDANPVDPIIVRLAELVAAAYIWENWERFNHGGEGRDEQPGRLSDADRIRAEIERICKEIKRSKVTIKTTGVVRTWGTQNEQGPIVVGPLKNGSFFDPREYVDPWGYTNPAIQKDPYYEAYPYSGG